MKARIRRIAHKRKGIVTESENIVEKQSISVGRATDRDIFLADSSVGYDHARINLLPDGSVSVSSAGRLGFYIEGKLAGLTEQLEIILLDNHDEIRTQAKAKMEGCKAFLTED